MSSARQSKDKHQLTTGAAAAGILALLVDAREAGVKDEKDVTKTEVLLDRAGLSLDDIATIMGKKYDAIRVSLQRSRGS
jgi:DNA-directed RNA polymerase specialized sigma24 family protein